MALSNKVTYLILNRLGKLKNLAGDTVVYGFSTILGRLLNWLLTPFYIRTISKMDFGIVVSVYSVIAVLLIIGTLGFETGYFRFISNKNKKRLFDTLSLSIVSCGLLILSVFLIFGDAFSVFLELGDNGYSLLIFVALIIIVDSLNSIPFAQLRYQNKSLKYSLLRLLQVVVTVVFNIVFLILLKDKTYFGITFSSIYSVHFILISNLLGSLSSTIYFLPQFLKSKYCFDFTLLKPVFVYCLPLVGMGFFGILNQNIEKILILKLVNDSNAYEQLAIYGANYKIGVLMAIFTQSFRLAFEPFFFKESKATSKTEIYGPALKYFVFFGLLIYAGVLLFMPLINTILTPDYYEGNKVIPFILLGQLLFGVYYSLSVWYKLIDKTYFGLLMSCAGLALNTVLNIILLPEFGYMGAAYSTFTGYLFMVIISFILGNKYYPISYPIRKITLVTITIVTLVFLFNYLSTRIFTNYWLIVSLLGFLTILAVLIFCENKFVNKLLIYVRR